MIVSNRGYMNKEQVLELLESGERFGIYETNRGTQILVKRPETEGDTMGLYTPNMSRVEWKHVEGKKVAFCKEKIFGSEFNQSEFDRIKWNNGNQIMSYEPYGY